jgi:hypothetical protein
VSRRGTEANPEKV